MKRDDEQPVLWAKLSWPALAELASEPPQMVMWPLGTTEQHGRHLPVDVDVRNCWEVACRVSARTGVPVLPALAYGDSGFWADWPGTLSVRPETLGEVITDVAAGIIGTGFRRLLLLNGHLGNQHILGIVEGRLRERFPDLQVRALSWWDVSQRVIEVMYADAYEGRIRSFHGNDGETSVYLSHSPDLVQMELAQDELVGADRPFFTYASRKLTESGVMGAPSSSSAERGEQILAMAVEDLAALITGQASTEETPRDVSTAPAVTT